MHRRRLSVLLILAVVAILGALLYISVRPSGAFRIVAPAPKPTTAVLPKLSDISSTLGSVSATTLLQKPRYTGQDAMGRNWLVTADNAGQEGSAASATYVLNTVNASFDDPSQTSPFSLTATQGRYQQTSATLSLSGQVSATAAGFNLTAPKLDADLTTRTLQTSGGTRVTGNTGGPKGWDVDIAAPNVSADQNSSRLVLTGGVRARFTPNGH